MLSELHGNNAQVNLLLHLRQHEMHQDHPHRRRHLIPRARHPSPRSCDMDLWAHLCTVKSEVQPLSLDFNDRRESIFIDIARGSEPLVLLCVNVLLLFNTGGRWVAVITEIIIHGSLRVAPLVPLEVGKIQALSPHSIAHLESSARFEREVHHEFPTAPSDFSHLSNCNPIHPSSLSVLSYTFFFSHQTQPPEPHAPFQRLLLFFFCNHPTNTNLI
jgi:hypothetical protein